jgi:hypothetical protein
MHGTSGNKKNIKVMINWLLGSLCITINDAYSTIIGIKKISYIVIIHVYMQLQFNTCQKHAYAMSFSQPTCMDPFGYVSLLSNSSTRLELALPTKNAFWYKTTPMLEAVPLPEGG